MKPKTLKQALKQYGAQADLARRLGISRIYLNMIVRGERRPGPNLALRIERLTGVPLRTLLFKNVKKTKAA